MTEEEEEEEERNVQIRERQRPSPAGKLAPMTAAGIILNARRASSIYFSRAPQNKLLLQAHK